MEQPWWRQIDVDGILAWLFSRLGFKYMRRLHTDATTAERHEHYSIYLMIVILPLSAILALSIWISWGNGEVRWYLGHPLHSGTYRALVLLFMLATFYVGVGLFLYWTAGQRRRFEALKRRICPEPEPRKSL